VDLIMDDAVTRQGTNARRVPRRAYYGHHTTFAHGGHRATYHGHRKHGHRNQGGRHAFIRNNERQGPGFLHAEAEDLRVAKVILERVNSLKQDTLMNSGPKKNRQSMLQVVRSSRATAQGRYVSSLIRYCRAANRMTSAEANRLQHGFTLTKVGLRDSKHLLGLYPRELQ